MNTTNKKKLIWEFAHNISVENKTPCGGKFLQPTYMTLSSLTEKKLIE